MPERHTDHPVQGGDCLRYSRKLRMALERQSLDPLEDGLDLRLTLAAHNRAVYPDLPAIPRKGVGPQQPVQIVRQPADERVGDGTVVNLDDPPPATRSEARLPAERDG